MDGTQRVFGPLRSRRKSSFSCPLGHHLSPVLFMMSDDKLFVPHKVKAGVLETFFSQLCNVIKGFPKI